MSNEWQSYELNELAKFRNGAGIKQEHFSSTGVKLVRVSDFTDDSIDLTFCTYITSEHAKKWETHYLSEGDVVVATVGSWPPNWSSAVGKVVRAPKGIRNAIQNQNSCCIIPNANKLDKRFLFYILKTIEFKWFAGNSAGGSANQARLPVERLKQYKTIFPPLPEQKAIAHILGTLDEKIELNRKMNQTLEAMAQALFKSWFVDFDPVIDNALAAGNEIPEELQARAEKRLSVIAGTVIASDEGARQSQTPLKPLLHTNPTLAAQFPDSFVFNETLGKWIPEGWEVKRVDEIATVVGGGTPSTKVEEYFTDNGVPWLSPKDLSGFEWKFIGKGATDITPSGLKNSGAKLMPAGSVLFSSRAPIGYIAIAENEICTNQGFKSLVPDKGVLNEYLYQLLKSNADKIEAVATGSTFKEVSGSALKGIEVLVPSSELLIEFSKKLKPSSERQFTIQKETETLTHLRDRLLPELISGRVRIREA
jgi:type I restriction enzyme S subunit